jgi:hypothetical protein
MLVNRCMELVLSYGNVVYPCKDSIFKEVMGRRSALPPAFLLLVWRGIHSLDLLPCEISLMGSVGKFPISSVITLIELSGGCENV